MLAALSSVAYAQSSVTQYGVIDAGFLYSQNSNGSKLYAMQAGWLQGNRWGLIGTEDLGGGYKAIFRLESGYSPLTGALGQGNSMFARQAYVGLDTPYDTATLGRQYDLVVDYVAPIRASTGFIVNQPAEFNNLGNDYRVNNAIKYASKDYRGLKFGGLFSLGGTAGDFQRNRVYLLAASYAQGPISVAASDLNEREPNFSYYGNNRSSSTTASNMSAYTIFPATHQLRRFKPSRPRSAIRWATSGSLLSIPMFNIEISERLPC